MAVWFNTSNFPKTEVGSEKFRTPVQTLENLEMKKTLVAIAALAATGAFAQSSVTLTGRASMDYSTYQATGATAGAAYDLKNRSRIADTGSRIGFGATEDLGGGMRAGVYCETGYNIDTATANGQAATANVNTSEFCSREGRAFIGQGDYELRLGRQNVWWTQGALNEVGSTYLGSDSLTNLINGGVGVYGVRVENMLKLAVTGGQFAGSEAYYGIMTTQEAAGATTLASGANNTGTVKTDPRGTYQGFKLSYTAGNIVGMVDYQSSKDAASVAASSTVAGTNSFDRSATKLGIAYKYNPTSLVSFQTWNKKRTDATTAGATYVSSFNNALNTTAAGDAKDSGYGIVVKHDLGGGWMAHGQYAKVGNIKGTSAGEQADTGAKAYTLGATKAFSKRTHVYGAYHVITNQANANYNMVGGSYQSAVSANGADVKVLAVGMIHNF